jgi:hypothetical protein
MAMNVFREFLIEKTKPRGEQTKLARFAGVDPSAVNKMVHGKQDLDTAFIAKMYEFYKEPLPQAAEVAPGRGLTKVVVAGKAEAGTFREVEDFNQDGLEELALPSDSQFPDARQFAVDVSGESMNALKPRPILPGDRLICVAFEDVAHYVSLRDGMVVLVERRRESGLYREWSVKQIELYPDRTEFHPRSSHARYKPIVIDKDFAADDGSEVEVIGLVRRIVNDVPLS